MFFFLTVTAPTVSPSQEPSSMAPKGSGKPLTGPPTSKLFDINGLGQEVLEKPRNERQLKNLRYKVQQNQRISRDAIINVASIAQEHGDFVHKYTLHPDIEIVAGNKRMFDELAYLLELPTSQRMNEMLLGYDTTFSLGEYYVSPLLFKHIAFIEKPVLPVAFLVHERKFTTTHATLFSTISHEILNLKKLQDVALVTDCEKAIENAASVHTSLKLVGC